MEALKIFVLGMASTIAYGILHDQVTARVCVEYFTIGHPPVFATEDPTVLALGWGTIATWWVGLILGVPLVLVARLGARPKVTAADLLRPIGVLLFVVAFTALVGGLIGFLLASAGLIELVGPMAVRVPTAQHAAFLADGFAHTTAYAVAFLGGLVVLRWVRRERQRRSGAASSVV